MKKSKSMCVGCYENYYNINAKGGCWMYGEAKVVTRMLVGTWQSPPYIWAPRKVLSCYLPNGQSVIEKTDFRVVTDAAGAKALEAKWNKEASE